MKVNEAGNVGEVAKSSNEKSKKVLTLKLLDSIEKTTDNVKASIMTDSYWYARFWVGTVKNPTWLYGGYGFKTMGQVIPHLFCKKETVLYKRGDYLCSKGEKSTSLWERYMCGGIPVYHIDDVRFIQKNDIFIPIEWAWRYVEISNGVWLIWFEDDGEIILKKFTSAYNSKFGMNSNSPYITLPWTRISQLDKWSSEFFVVNDWNVDKIVLENMAELGAADLPIKYKVEETLSFDQFGAIQQIESDINDNFVLIVWKKDDKFSLYVLKKSNWQSWEVMASIQWVKEFVVMPDNTLLWVMEDWAVKKIATTFDQFEKWYFEGWWDVIMREEAVKAVRNNAHEKMLEAIKSAEIKELESWTDSDDLGVSEQDVISEFWSKKVEDKTIKELFEEAETQEEIRKVERLVNGILVSISSFTWGIKIKNHIKDVIIKKKEEIILRDFKKDVNDVNDALEKAESLQDLLKIKSLITELHERKKDIRWGSLAIDLWNKIKEMMKTVDTKISEYKEEGKDDILAQIQRNTEELKLYIESISYGSDLSQIYNLDIWKETMKLLEYLGEDEKKKQRKELLSLVSKRSLEIVEEEKKEAEKKEQEIIRRKEEIDGDIDILVSILETVHTVESVNEIKESDALAKRIDEEIKSLPKSVWWELEIKYNKAFKDRIFHIRRENIKEKGIIHNLDESWIDTMLYYVDTKKKGVSWDLRGTPTAQWLIKLEISIDGGKRTYSWDDFFEDSDKFADVLIWDDIKFEITQSEYIKLNKQLDKWRSYGKSELNKLLWQFNECTSDWEKEELLKKIQELKSQYKKARYVEKLANRIIMKEKLSPRSRVPEVDHNYIVLDEEKQSLESLSWNLLTQKKWQKGIVILKWWPWLWKTVMCEYLAAATNREIVRVQCSKKISYSEFFFAPTLKKGETSHSPAEWIKMMQKPWTIILFDEIDKLSADCMSWLHALFDSWRHVHDPQLWDFYADPDCLFLWTMNSYDPLPKAIASRSTIETIYYPSEINEAYKISKYVDDEFLKELDYEEFKELWDNQDEKGEKGKNSKEHKINETLHNIRKLLKVFQLLRAKYDAEYDKFEYELSYRDAAQIFAAYNISHNFKKAVSDILVGKASSVVWPGEQKDQMGMVLDAIRQVFWK